MPSSKGKPTDPKLREKVKEEVKNETNKDGSGKGQWSAWKAAKLSKEYEKKGGSYENESGSKNKPKKGPPQPKPSSKKKAEEKKTEHSDRVSPDEEKEDAPASVQKPKANTGKKKDQKSDLEKNGTKSGAKSGQERKEGTLKGKGLERSEGTRKSTRIAGKRKTDADNEDEKSAKKKK
ncbi:hypothetical protein BKA66DRAFT_16414 [Pyrenochaeta sp. MPI-SDFR-AT-0127]|nr:hypothetical protein BKA66DRAFT_16414 [Pyrenochaeta sp. MPI-SDFR-AT-0127]